MSAQVHVGLPVVGGGRTLPLVVCWLVSSSVERRGLWCVVAFAGIGGGAAVSGCPKHLVVAPAMAPPPRAFGQLVSR